MNKMSGIQKHLRVGLVLVLVLIITPLVFAENIDPDNDGAQYAYGENVGWFNWEPAINSGIHGVHVYDNYLDDYIWAENIGWINLRYQIGGTGPDTDIGLNE